MRCVTPAQRAEAAKRAAGARSAVSGSANRVATPKFGSSLAAPVKSGSVTPMPAGALLAAPFFPLLTNCLPPVMDPMGQPDYMSGCVANYATSPVPIVDALTGAYVSGGLRKFVDPLPNIPVAVPDTITYPGSDYYEISLEEYHQKMHSDLANSTLLRGYRQTNLGTDLSGHNTLAPPAIQYLGPLIIAKRDKPVRLKFTNHLPAGAGGNLFIPVDPSVMGAGMGPDGMHDYSQNRANIHLHGGNTPWISDGTPHQWTTPATENTPYPKGVSTRDVPDMPATGPGEMTFFYTNAQSARLMFYHDHAYGITRLNVYAGEAAGYLLQDPVEQTLVTGGTITPPAGAGAPIVVPPGTIPADQLPLVIQDKTFVPLPDQLAAQDPTWGWGPTDVAGNFLSGDLWFPHVYMTNQNPSDNSGVNAMGRWDWGPWFWPAMDPSTLKVGELLCPTVANPSQVCPGTPNPSLVPEAFMDTPVVNGMAYPYVKVEPKAYRLRILNASNDRTLNLSLYQAYDAASKTMCAGLPTVPAPGSPASQPSTCTEVSFVPPPDGIAAQGPIPDPTTKGPNMIQIGTEGGFLPAPVTLTNTPISYNYNRRDIVVLNVADKNLWLGPANRADVIVDFSAFAGKTLILYNDSGAPVPAFDTRYDYYTGDPDQTETGGAPTTLAGYGPNIRTIMQIQVANNTPVPFNPAPLTTALPVAYAASQDAPIIPEAAYGPAYKATYPNSYSRIQDTSLFTGKLTGVSVVTPGSGYTTAPKVTISAPAGGGTAATATATVAGGVVTGFTLTNPGAGYTSNPAITLTGGGGKGASAAAVGIPMLRKTIQELFELDYGRMNATLGTEMAFTNFNTQTTIPLGYIDPPTENFGDGETQIWKITHNGVDTHAIHFHLFNVQLINRVGWDGAVRPPDPNELGWKETVLMSPLEDAIVALKPVKQNLPFPLPDSIRLQDVTSPEGASIRVVDSLSGNTTNVTNANINFGQEYVWHCHLLGHEENDMMRPMIFQVAPEPPVNLIASGSLVAPVVTLSFTDKSVSETGFLVQRSTDSAFVNNLVPFSVPGQAGAGNTVTWTDNNAASSTTYYYRAQAINNSAFNGYDATGAMLTKTLYSAWTPTVNVTYPPAAALSPKTQAFGYQLLNTTGAAKTITLSNVGQGTLTNIVIGFSGVNASEFTQTNNCGATLAAAATCSINVSFRPTATGARTAALNVASNDPVNPIVSASLTGSGAGALMSSPTPGTVLAGSAVTFNWTGAAGVSGYYLWIGTTPGSNNLMNFGVSSATSTTAFNLPTNSKPVYVRLYAVINGVLSYVDYTYTAAAAAVQQAAQLTAPANGSAIVGGTTTFSWNAGSGVVNYQLWIGTTAGSSNLYAGPRNTSRSYVATGLPTNGSTVYVRLWSYYSVGNAFVDYTFTTSLGAPNGLQLVSPTPGTTLHGSTITFTWNAVVGATGYYLWVGNTGVGSRNIINYGITKNLSVSVPGIPTNGSTLNVRLYMSVNGALQFVDYTYVTGP